ncbi:CYTH domain-containing protein [Bosea sp. 2YAB26]|uniref:CYTH domain-containing protein n=1 Tax=Bosea sp. 2YAB26 TaxID=3237478 RepID=UPI003F93361B
MHVEIERKFLVTGDQWRSVVKSEQHLRDGLLAQFGGGKVRVRLGANRAWLTIKGPRVGATRSEYEYEISCADAEEMLSTLCNGQVIEKTRFLVPYDGLTWMVDVYEAALEGLVIAEIELEHEGQVVELPTWVGPEVTNDPKYKKTRFQKRLKNGREFGYASI